MPFDPTTWYLDADRDGFGDPNSTRAECLQPIGYADNARDCNDETNDAHPGGIEICDGIDNDCNGVIDPVELNCPRDSSDAPNADPVEADEASSSGQTCGCSSNSGMGSLAGMLLLLPWLVRRRRVA